MTKYNSSELERSGGGNSNKNLDDGIPGTRQQQVPETFVSDSNDAFFTGNDQRLLVVC